MGQHRHTGIDLVNALYTPKLAPDAVTLRHYSISLLHELATALLKLSRNRRILFVEVDKVDKCRYNVPRALRIGNRNVFRAEVRYLSRRGKASPKR